MSRSGNHAIIDWLLAQAPGRTCFLNCAEPTRNPFRWARPLAPDAPGWRATYDLDIEAERAGRLSRKDYLVHSYEDVFLGAFRNPVHEARREQFVGASGSRIDVLILRDPFNLLASRRASRIGTMAPELAMRVWCQHARQFLRVRRYLAPDAVCVNYNLWASSREYRRSVSRLLGLEFDDRAAALVPPCAGGSSFDGRRHDGSAARMAVFD